MGKNNRSRRLKKIKQKELRLKQKERILKTRYSQIGNIFFDESGNTGTNLLDSVQPVFALGSCDFTEREGKSLIKPLMSMQSTEIKFVNLKRRTSGQDAIINLLKHRLVTPKRVMYAVLHKKFVVVTKIVDDLIENFLSRQGYDLYQGAGNVALSNLLFMVIPAFCGQDEFDTFLTRFMVMTKKRDQASIDDFYHQIEVLNDICQQKGNDLSQEIFLLSETKYYIHDIFDTLPSHSNNPAVPALFALSQYWGNLYKKGFNIKHDDAKPVEQQKQILQQFSAISQKKVKFGYGIREFEIPLKTKRIEFIDSKTSYRIQLTDIITSSLTYWLKHKIEDNTEDPFYKKLDKIDFEQYIKNSVWPTEDVTPESLGASSYEIKENPADVVAKYLRKAGKPKR